MHCPIVLQCKLNDDVDGKTVDRVCAPVKLLLKFYCPNRGQVMITFLKKSMNLFLKFKSLAMHGQSSLATLVAVQLLMSAGGGVRQINDLTAYIESDDCSHALHQYTGDGKLVREIRLPSNVTEPQHALQLTRPAGTPAI